MKKYLSSFDNGRVIILEPKEILETKIIRSNNQKKAKRNQLRRKKNNDQRVFTNSCIK